MVWHSRITLSNNPQSDFMNADVEAWGDSKEEALAATKLVYKLLADGKERLIRCAPSVASRSICHPSEFVVEGDTVQIKSPPHEVEHKGYVRFAFRDARGKEHLPSTEFCQDVILDAQAPQTL